MEKIKINGRNLSVVGRGIIVDENREPTGKILFCGSDVAKALGYSDTAKAIKTHCKQDGWAICPVTDTLGRNQK